MSILTNYWFLVVCFNNLNTDTAFQSFTATPLTLYCFRDSLLAEGWLFMHRIVFIFINNCVKAINLCCIVNITPAAPWLSGQTMPFNRDIYSAFLLKWMFPNLLSPKYPFINQECFLVTCILLLIFIINITEDVNFISKVNLIINTNMNIEFCLLVFLVGSHWLKGKV